MIKNIKTAILETKNLGKSRIIGLNIGIALALHLVFLFGGLHSALAKDIKVSATAEPKSLGVGEVLDYVISVSTDTEVDSAEPKITGIDGFQLLDSNSSSSFQSSMVQGTNGFEFVKSHSLNYNYRLQAQKEGPWSIGPFEVVVDGHTYKTNSIRVNVVKAGAAPKRRSLREDFMKQRQKMLEEMMGGGMPKLRDLLQEDEQDESQMNQLFGQLQRRPAPKGDPAFRSLPKNDREAFFVTLELDKTEVYEGEQLTANWYIYTRGNILQMDRLTFPSLRGFWKEDIEAAPNIIFQQEVVNGVPFKKALLASSALFPIKSGNVDIDEYKIKATVSMPSMGGFGFGQAYEYTRSSERVAIKVKPLPAEGRPASFSGAIGTFNVSSSIEEKEFFVGQPFTLKVRFEGEGNAKMIELPPIEFPANLEKYDVQSESKYYKSGQGFKEFRVLIIPKEQGALTVPEFSFSYFDTTSKKYDEKKVPAIPIQVQPARPGSIANASGFLKFGDKKKDLTKPKDIEPSLVLTQETSAFSAPWLNDRLNGTWFWTALYTLAALGQFVYASISFGLFSRKKNIRDLLKERMKRLTGEIDKGKLQNAGVEGVNLVHLILGEVSGLGGATVGIDKMLEAIPPSVRRDVGADIKSLLNDFQTLAFGKEEFWGDLKNTDTLKVRAAKLETCLEKAISLNQE